MKKLSFLCALLCASMMSFAIDWSGVAWLGNGAGEGYTEKYKAVVSPDLPAPGFINNLQTRNGKPSIHVVMPSAVFGATSLQASQYETEGAGVFFHLDAFPALENEFTFVCSDVTYTFTVYFADGTQGGGNAEPTSEYCGEIMSSGNTEAAFTWETNDAGAVVITISETLGGADEATHFRGNGINIDKIKVGEAREDAATYFDLACGGSNTITLSLKEGKTLEQGTKIYVTSQIIEYATSKDGNAWPTLTFEYTYGTKCSSDAVLTRIALSAASSFVKIGESVTLTAQAKDQLNKNMDAVISFEVSPADAGVVADGKYTPAKAGAAVITAKSGEISESLTIYGVSSDNLALSKPVVAGYEPGNQDELSSKMVDGDANTQWVTYADQSASVEWAYIDLGGKYNVEAIDVLWGDPTSTSYILQVRAEAPTAEQAADDEAWTTVAEQSGITINSEQFNVVKAAARYVRIHSLTKSANFFRLKEVRVFGTEWVDVDDNEKPVMVSAELVSAGWDNAVIAVAATDNHEVAAFRVVETANSIDKKLLPADGKITLAGLTASTTYNFVITAIDGANNESANSKAVAVTTDSHLTAPTEVAVAPTWPAAQVKAIYSPTYNADCNFQDWGSGTVYSQDTYGKKYALANGGYFGVDGFSLNCINMEKLHYDIWIADDATLRIVPICRNAADNGNEPEYGEFVNLKGQQWNSVDLALNEGEYAKVTNWSNVYQVKIDNAANLTIWVGNAFFYRTAAIEDNEAPTDVAASLASASYFSATLTLSAKDNSGAVSFSVLNGGNEVATGGGASGATVNVTVPGLLPNTEYNFSVIAKDEAGNAADPVAVSAKTLAAPAPAPTPDFTGKQAVPVFCDALDGGPGINIGGWGQTTVTTFGQLAEGDNVCYGTNFNYLGWELTPAVNATDMEYLHVDVYAQEMTSVSVTPISPGKEKVIAKELTPGQWSALDIALSEYESAGIDWSNIFQFKFDKPVGGNSLFVDNVYFYKVDGGTAVDTINAAAPATKFIENGSLFILRDGVVYTIQGAVVR
ncbi:MAG: discoidin domain-containing protein [Paludibacteraceae bacterium]|nr:discoidin domain-containing protein [Paludibacteraceae bacterium]